MKASSKNRHIGALATAADKLEKTAEGSKNELVVRRHARRLRTLASNLKRGKLDRAKMLFRRSKDIVKKAVSPTTADWLTN